jgi:hypothetical protein
LALIGDYGDTRIFNWQAGDTIPLGPDRMLRVIETRFTDEDPVLVVEPQ